MGDNVHLVSMAVIFLSATAGSVSARCLRANARALSLALIFGGGVFVSAGFIHLLGSAQQAFAADAYPWATFWCSVGVMATLLVEESTIALLRWREAKAKQCKTCPPIASSSLGKTTYGTAVSPLLLSVQEQQKQTQQQQTQQQQQVQRQQTPPANPASPLLLNLNSPGGSARSISSTGLTAGGGGSEAPCPVHPGGTPEGKAMAVILYLALSFHSFMEGLGVGVSSAGAAWGLTFAIVAHKGVATFALGTSVVRSGVSTLEYALAMLPFCCVTPVGVLVGMSIQSSGNDRLTNTVLALAGGTFICIGLMEIIAKELPGDSDKLLKIALVLVGWGIFALLAVWC
jgi:zinc transporter ZupT